MMPFRPPLAKNIGVLDHILFVSDYLPISLQVALINLGWGVLWILASPQSRATLLGLTMSPDHLPSSVGGMLFAAMGLVHLYLLSRLSWARVALVFVSMALWLELGIRAILFSWGQQLPIPPSLLLMIIAAADSAWVFVRLCSDLSRLPRPDTERDEVSVG